MGKKHKDHGNTSKYAALIVIGILTLLYSLTEIAAALYFTSLTLLSDGFHNLSDVIALVIAFWALKKAEQGPTKLMTYGWKRTEILGAVMNGCFLLALCLYTILESIPRFFEAHDQFDEVHGHTHLGNLSFAYIFIIIASSGLAINLAGTVAFAIVGANAHGHSHADGAHGHGHGDDEDHKHHDNESDHGHSYLHKEKKDKGAKEGAHGHSHAEKKAKKEKENDHSHHADGEHGHSHDKKEKNKKKDDGHGHSHDGEAHDHGHDVPDDVNHSHTLKKEKSKLISDDSVGINTSSDGTSYEYRAPLYVKPGEGEKELLLVASGGKKPRKKGKTDHNIRAVFLHYLGDALSSLCVLVTGLLYHFFPTSKSWTVYLDPVSSLVIVALILVTTIPFVKSASVILLQRVPNEVSIPHLTEDLLRVDGVLDVHDLHVWQLVDKMVIASVHVRIEATDVEHCKRIMTNAKAVFHRCGVHSCTMQPEFIPKGFMTGPRPPRPCSENCVEACVEDWCCKAEEEIVDIGYGSLV